MKHKSKTKTVCFTCLLAFRDVVQQYSPTSQGPFFSDNTHCNFIKVKIQIPNEVVVDAVVRRHQHVSGETNTQRQKDPKPFHFKIREQHCSDLSLLFNSLPKISFFSVVYIIFLSSSVGVGRLDPGPLQDLVPKQKLMSFVRSGWRLRCQICVCF